VTTAQDFAPALAEQHLFGELSADGQNVVIVTAEGEFEPTTLGHLSDITVTARATKPKGGVQYELSWPLAVQLGAELGPLWHPGARYTAWLTGELLKRARIEPVTGASELRTDAPAPRHYQLAGASIAAATGRGGFVFDDPGTGKTLTAILAILALRDRGQLPIAAPIIVVCPNSVIDSWVSAWQTWTTLKVAAWRGAASTRRRLAETDADVFVVAYATARNDMDPYSSSGGPITKLSAGAMVIDECHMIKNPQAVQSQVVRKLAAKTPVTIALSGTPITHNAGDLHPTLFAVDPAAWPSRERYSRRYLNTIPGDYGDTVIGLSEREPELRQCLMGQYRSLRKADVLTELPPKVYSVRSVAIPDKYRKQYDQMESDMLAQLDDGKELPAPTVLAQLTRLSQLASAAADVTSHTELKENPFGEMEEVEKLDVTLKLPSWKVDALLEILGERTDKQTLVFAPSRQLINLADAECRRAGYSTATVVGGQTARERTLNVDEFQSGKRQVLLATTSAGGVGLTLTAASTVVFLQRPWSYVEASQAEDRAHRIGSEIHESIEIVDVVAEKTVESRVRSVLRDKARSLAELLEDPRIAREVLGGLK
jgi:SNF2 family DNA or RNA helicase